MIHMKCQLIFSEKKIKVLSAAVVSGMLRAKKSQLIFSEKKNVILLRLFGQTQFKWFVCVEVLRPSRPNGVLSNVVSLPNHTFTGQA